MSGYLGDFPYGAPVYVPFNTFDSNGASITLTGLAVTDIEIYRDGGTTQRASDNGYTLLDTDGIDFDGITGIHGFSIDTSDNSTAGFFGPGSDYFVVISSVTVDTRTVNFVRSFSIENRHTAGLLVRTTIATLGFQTSFTLTAGSADDNAYNDCEIVVQAAGSTVQKAVGVVQDYDGASKTVTLFADPAVFTMAVGDYVSIYAVPPRVNVNVTHIDDDPVDTSVVQLGVNVVQAGGVYWNSGAITNNTFTSGAIDANAIASNAIGPNEVSAAAVVKIQAGLATAAALSTVAGYLDTEIAALLEDTGTTLNDLIVAIKAKTDLIPGTTDGLTFAEKVTLFAAVLLGKASGLDTTTAVYRAVDDSKDRVTAQVDSDGNRAALTLDAA
jgi:hypothetical protein